MNKKIALILTVAGCTLLTFGCGKKDTGGVKDYSKYVELAPYTGQTIDRYVAEVTDEDVDLYVEEELSYGAEYNEINDRAAQDGDLVVIDYVGKIDGEEFEGGSEEDVQIELGADAYIDGFEDAIVGMNAGDEKSFDITFPTPYDGELDGKTATFTVTLHSIVEVVLPEYNDEYVASISDCSTVEEFEESLREELQQTYLEDAQTNANEEFLSTVIADSVFNGYPDELYEICKTAEESENQELMEEFGISDIAELYGEDYDEEADLEEAVHERMAICTIAAKEGIEVTDEEYKEVLEDEMQYSDYLDVDEYESAMVPDPDEYKYNILREKVLAFLGENNVYNDISEDEYYEDDELDISDLGLEDIEVEGIEELPEETSSEEAKTDAEE